MAEVRLTKVCSAGEGGSGTKGANIGLSGKIESGFAREAAAGEAERARKDSRRLEVRRPAESQVESNRFRLNIIVEAEHGTTKRVEGRTRWR